MHVLKYVVYKDGDYYVSQCLNVDVSSFGDNIDDAISNLKDAVTLYLRDESEAITFKEIQESLIGETLIYA